jgi:uncharacterized iron-regulated protein
LIQAAAQNMAFFNAINLDTGLAVDKLTAQLATKRVVFIGEIHNRYDHHLNQLAIIRRLHELKPDIAIGIEYLPRSTQPQVDDYIAGRTSEQEFLRAAAYYRKLGIRLPFIRSYFSARSRAAYPGYCPQRAEGIAVRDS